MDNKVKSGTVSVIIPVYQAEKYLLRCVESVIEQTYQMWEIILIDDGSTDGSPQICNELAKKNSSIRVFHQENAGVAAARNKGLDYATGAYILFLDSDDWIDDNALMDMVKSMQGSKADLCICGYQTSEKCGAKEYCFDMNGQVSIEEFYEKYFWNLYDDTILFNIGTKIYKKEIIERYNLRFRIDMTVYEDISFFLKYLDQTETVFLCGQPYYYYFKENDHSITHVYKKEFWRNTSEYCKNLLERFEDDTLDLRKAILVCLYRAYLQECHAPKLNKRSFKQQLLRFVFPIEESMDHKDNTISGVSFDIWIFQKLIAKRRERILWILAKIISLKKR